MSRDGSPIRTLYIRRKQKWVAVGFLSASGKATIYSNKETKEILKDVFSEWFK